MCVSVLLLGVVQPRNHTGVIGGGPCSPEAGRSCKEEPFEGFDEHEVVVLSSDDEEALASKSTEMLHVVKLSGAMTPDSRHKRGPVETTPDKPIQPHSAEDNRLLQMGKQLAREKCIDFNKDFQKRHGYQLQAGHWTRFLRALAQDSAA